MANPARKLSANAGGEFYVDAACIDCSACRWVAPGSFGPAGDASVVCRQPEGADARHRALMALITCPVGAIGTVDAASRADIRRAIAAFPDRIADGVYHCGYHSEASFGAASYFIRRPGGNVLIDSPRFAGNLIKRLEDWGGVDMMFLTHRDDVAEHQRFHDHFGCRRIIHAGDAQGALGGLEMVIEGTRAVALAPDLTVIPVPGHTPGSACLLFADDFLFSGDHLWWNPEAGSLRAGRHVCWYDWALQTRSMAALAHYRFSWVLPGHSFPGHLEARDMARELKSCIAWMEGQ